ncbi:MAG: hypothetical protein ACUBOA_06475 [Candidatus Loosdrechtia sp.]|uniref:hypothetical protein n=1 Tax=Candidatus Loosdrechtia sp. TaxID=3101272 RepID=UPI003A76A3C7|nr:MAG: hypothetical protein QY305_10560 [Candidatus Jettenia sp. AMX2]
MNSSQLRKFLSDLFTRVFRFWILTGIIFLLLMVSLLLVVYPLSKQCTKRYNGLQDLADTLEKYALKKDLYNSHWIESKKAETELYKAEVEKCRSFLKRKDDLLEAVFVIEDPERGHVTIDDEALWRSEYLKRASALLVKIQENKIIFHENALPFQKWGSDIPSWDAILPAQKRFWILETLINAVIKTKGITKLENINFREVPYSYNPSPAQLYTAIPLTLKVELQAGRIQFLLREILGSDIPFVIEGIVIVSTDKNDDSGFTLKHGDVLTQDVDGSLPDPVVGVTLDVYVIDYNA